jgi:hopanoid biosynthesis associated RND transporter like protein HpnN
MGVDVLIRPREAEGLPDGRLLAGLVGLCARRRLVVLLAAAILVGLSVFASARLLGVTTDTGTLFTASLPWKQRSTELAQLFPQNDKLIVAVIDAAIPELADQTAADLAAALAPDHTHFTSIRRPDALPYLRHNALLLIPQDDLRAILDRTIDAQPFLGQLAPDPTLRGLFSALGLVAEGVKRGQPMESMRPAMESFHAALSAAASGHPAPLSWERLIGGKLADQAGRFRFVLMKPVLDYGALQPGGIAGNIAREAAARLPEVRSGAARVRFTGQVVLDDEEFATVAEGAVAGLIASFLLVAVWLYLALRSWRLIVPVLTTLVAGLLLTTGFAAVAVGTLNLVSVAFAVLFVGIAVDFAIQFAVRFREHLVSLPAPEAALTLTGRRVGGQIMVASFATAAGFLAFGPTAFKGVAQLGVIAGAGMLIAFACTLTLLPAMLALCRPTAEAEVHGLPKGATLDRWTARHRRALVAGFGLLALGGAATLPFIPFDGDPLHTKDQRSESVRTLQDLSEDSFTNPFTVQALLPSPQAASAAASALQALPQTQLVLSLDSFFPSEQPAKLALIKDAADILAPTLAAAPGSMQVTAGQLRLASARLAATLGGLAGRLPADDVLLAIGRDAAQLAQAPDDTLLEADRAITRFLPGQLAQLHDVLTVGPVTQADIPAALRREWQLPDGTSRVQALPRAGAGSGDAQLAWAAAAAQAVPNATGSAIYILESTRIVVSAFRMAALSALAGIALILSLALRRALDVAMVMTPLLTSALLTALLLHALGLPLNFANVIALPLLLGVGVSFNIYFVMNWRAGVPGFLSTPTARAVLFSALTTGTAFGSLAISHHPGTASMGVLLLLSLACTVVVTLMFVPALLGVVRR